MKISLKLSIHAAAGKTMVPYLRRHLRAAHALAKSPLKELSIALVGDAVMSRLHEKYLANSGPTDVLTFELDHDSRGRATSGEVVVCIPQARRQSATVGWAYPPTVRLRREVLLLALHGLLHLSGFDDRTNPQFAAMHRAEDRILSQLGVGRVFGTGKRERP